jgi:hypothetical protein
MSAIFSIGFSMLFAAFIVLAIIGHVLLIGALLRPFFGKSNPVPMLMWHGRRAQPVR